MEKNPQFQSVLPEKRNHKESPTAGEKESGEPGWDARIIGTVIY